MYFGANLNYGNYGKTIKMNEIDLIVINFDQTKLNYIYAIMSILTFSVALDISIDDFRSIFKTPKKVLAGLFSQLVILPTFTILLIYFWQPIPSIALGLALIASCPGGGMSNYASHLSKGNAALSVTLTSFVTLLALVTTPVIFATIANFFPETSKLLSEIELDKKDIVWSIIQLILIPLCIGLWLNNRRPAMADKLRKPLRIISLVIFVGLLLGALVTNLQNIFEHLHLVFWLVVVHNIGAYILGYYFGKLNKLPEADCRTLTIETGIQNVGLGLVIIFGFFQGLGGMMLVAAWWGVWDLISVLILAIWWNRY